MSDIISTSITVTQKNLSYYIFTYRNQNTVKRVLPHRRFSFILSTLRFAYNHTFWELDYIQSESVVENFTLTVVVSDYHPHWTDKERKIKSKL